MLKVKVENPAALRFILQDDIYLLDEDKQAYLIAPVALPEIKTEPVVFNYTGHNKKNFLIVVHYPETEVMADAHQVALESVLSRKNHTLDDVAILNLHRYPGTSMQQLADRFKPQTLLLLGKAAIPAGLTEPGFNTPVNHEGINLLYTYSFDEMMGSNDNKKAFWEKVKTL